MRHLALALHLVFAPSLVLATTIHVPADQPTIQAGIDAASAEDTVLVACGTYYEYSIEMKAGIVLQSESGVSGCVILDAQYLPCSEIISCVELDPAPIIKGLIFRHTAGTTGQGNGMALRSWSTSVVVDNCTFMENTAGIRGAGIELAGLSYPIVRECVFVDNEAGEGGAVYCSNGVVPSIDNCYFDSNQAGYDGGAIRIENCGGLVEISECVFVRNESESGAGISLYECGNPTIRDCTFYGNSATTGSAIYAGSDSHPVVENSILSFGLQGSGAIGMYGGTLQFECSDIFGNAGGDWIGAIADQLGVNGNISADPLFCDPDMGDFSLRSDSPCAPDNNDCGVLMGAWPVGCSTSAESATWSEVKTLY